MKTKRVTKTERIDVLAEHGPAQHARPAEGRRCAAEGRRRDHRDPEGRAGAARPRDPRPVPEGPGRAQGGAELRPSSRLPPAPARPDRDPGPDGADPGHDRPGPARQADQSHPAGPVPVDRAEAAGALVTFRACGIVAIMLNPDGTEPEVEPDGGRSAILRALGNTR